MITTRDILLAMIVPGVVAAAIAAVGYWRRWALMFPLAAGMAFLTGYALHLGGLPRFPPRDGTDWLFWCAIPLTLLGVVDVATRTRLGWLMGMAAGGVAYLIMKPLSPHAIPAQELWLTAVGAAAVGAATTWAVSFASTRAPAWAGGVVLSGVMAGAGALVFSSNLGIVGLYAFAAAASLAGATVFSARLPSASPLAVVSIPLLVGVLTGGHHYPDPGASMLSVVLLALVPMLLVLAVMIPAKKSWVRGVVAIVTAALATGAIIAPAALAAKKDAEGGDYSDYGY